MGYPPRGHADFLAPGDYNARCSICAQKYKASELVQNWMGMYRCQRCNEPRQPQDFVRGVQDVITVPWSQPTLSEYVQICTFNGQSAVCGYSIAGCMIAGRSVISYDETIPAGG